MAIKLHTHPHTLDKKMISKLDPEPKNQNTKQNNNLGNRNMLPLKTIEQEIP